MAKLNRTISPIQNQLSLTNITQSCFETLETFEKLLKIHEVLDLELPALEKSSETELRLFTTQLLPTCFKSYRSVQQT